MKLILSLSLSGTVLIVLLLLSRPLYRDRLSKRWQYYIWLIVILRLLLPVTPGNSLTGTFFHRTEQTLSAFAATSRPSPDDGQYPPAESDPESESDTVPTDATESIDATDATNAVNAANTAAAVHPAGRGSSYGTTSCRNHTFHPLAVRCAAPSGAQDHHIPEFPQICGCRLPSGSGYAAAGMFRTNHEAEPSEMSCRSVYQRPGLLSSADRPDPPPYYLTRHGSVRRRFLLHDDA